MTVLMVIIAGFSGGLIVGVGISAFLTILGIITRLVNITKTSSFLKVYKWSIITGAFLSSLFYFCEWHLPFFKGTISIFIVGLVMGVFIGMITSALAEVIDVIPLISIKLGVTKWVYVFIYILMAAKVVGSILYWSLPDLYWD